MDLMWQKREGRAWSVYSGRGDGEHRLRWHLRKTPNHRAMGEGR